MATEARGAVIGTCVVLLLGVVTVPVCSYAMLNHFDGVFEGALLVGDAIIVGEVTSASSGGEGSIVLRRLVRLSRETGEETSRVRMEGEVVCAPMGGRVFCFGDELRSYDERLQEHPNAWYGDGALGEPFEEAPPPRVGSDRLFVRARSGAWLAVFPDGRATATEAPPEDLEPLAWPSRGITARATDVMPHASRISDELDWLVRREESLVPEDGAYLGVLRADGYADVAHFSGSTIVHSVLVSEGDAIVIVRVEDHTEILRMTAQGELVFRVAL